MKTYIWDGVGWGHATVVLGQVLLDGLNLFLHAKSQTYFDMLTFEIIQCLACFRTYDEVTKHLNKMAYV